MILAGDVFLPAADEWPLSITMLDRAKQLGKPALLAYPVGALGRVSTFMPESPYAAECVVIPPTCPITNERLHGRSEQPQDPAVLPAWLAAGAGVVRWWCEGRKPHAQLCTIVWLTSVITAMEMLKLVSGKWQPVVAPRYWHVTPEGAHMARFSPARRWLARQRWGAALVPFLAQRPWLVRLFTRAIS